jgi:hypothetical protein
MWHAFRLILKSCFLLKVMSVTQTAAVEKTRSKTEIPPLCFLLLLVFSLDITFAYEVPRSVTIASAHPMATEARP